MTRATRLVQEFEAALRDVEESLRVVPCSGCLRLLYDGSWKERDLMPPALRSVPGAKA